MPQRRLIVLLLCLSWAGAALAASAPECLRCVVVYGDTRTGHEVHRRIVREILTLSPSVVFHTGDLVKHGTSRGDWKQFAAITSELRRRAEFFPVLGNHDRKGEEKFFSLFPKLEGRHWYAVERAGVLFLALDDHEPLAASSPQRAWLEEQLASKAEGARFTAVLLHQPLLSSGPHGPARFAAELTQLLEQRGVDVVFGGHDHDYERSWRNGVFYIVTGGGGAPLYDPETPNAFSQKFVKTYNYVALSVVGDLMTVEAFDENRRPIDRFEIRARETRPR